MGTVTRIGRGPAGLPFSRMTLKDGRFFLSGQVAQNPETGRIDHPGCYEQSLTVLGNIRGILAEAGFAPEQVAKMTVFLTDMGQKDAFDRAFERVFRRVPEEGAAPGSPEGPGTGEGGAGLSCAPACTCVGVAALGFGSGLGGAVVASRAGLTGNQVVVQQVERSTDATAAGSTDGTSMSVQQIASVVSPSVVAITTEQMSSSQTWFGGYYVQSGAGSGVIISQDGYILTCAHVVSGATSVKVQLNGSDESYDATVVGQDSTSDIAVLKIDATGLTPAVIGDSDALAVGEVAVAVGNPLGTLSNTVTDGIVSALNRQVTVQNNDMTLIQTDASISPGNSGGGLFNANGELIGIVNAKSSYSEAEGIGFAIPINTAMEIGRQLIENGSVARPALGVKIVDVTDAQTAQQLGVSTMGVYVVEVTKGSGADAAGVQAGDRVLAVDDTAVSDSSALKNYLKDKGIGDTVNLQVERDGKVLTLAVTLGSSAQ